MNKKFIRRSLWMSKEEIRLRKFLLMFSMGPNGFEDKCKLVRMARVDLVKFTCTRNKRISDIYPSIIEKIIAILENMRRIHGDHYFNETMKTLGCYKGFRNSIHINKLYILNFNKLFAAELYPFKVWSVEKIGDMDVFEITNVYNNRGYVAIRNNSRGNLCKTPKGAVASFKRTLVKKVIECLES